MPLQHYIVSLQVTCLILGINVALYVAVCKQRASVSQHMGYSARARIASSVPGYAACCYRSNLIPCVIAAFIYCRETAPKMHPTRILAIIAMIQLFF